MDGNDLVEQLRKKFDCASDRDLAAVLGYTPMGIVQVKNQSVTERRVAEIVNKARVAAVKQAAAVRPIVEFFPLDEDGDFLSKSQPDHVHLRKLLSQACGIYSFYNSELEVIYIGKTVERNIFAEAKNAYRREMLHYERYRVHHPRGRFANANDGKVRKISKAALSLHDAAQYFSAYALNAEMISPIETLLIRMLPNDLLNVRMEGNTSLEPFAGASE
jgi:hypothetical protein